VARAFQSNAFQFNAFQIGDPSELPIGSTILQRHKVDVSLSRKKWREYRKQWKIDALNAERELKRKKRKEVDEPLGYAKIEYDKYGYEVAKGEAAFHEFMRGLEMAQAQRAFQQAQGAMAEAAARQRAINEFNRRAAMQHRAAVMRQFQRDTEEEEEALELLMMDD
jgi:hypothetical protein